MNSEIICVGTELLMGDVLNTNASVIASKLAMLGINCYYHTVVGDNPIRLKDVVLKALERSDLIVLTGGLGPTYDDLTKEVVADALGLSMHFDHEIYKGIEDYFNRMGRIPTKNNERQAFVPYGAKVLVNHHGTAPGILIEHKDKVVILLPGPPHELIHMFDDSVFPYLVSKNDTKIVSRRVYLFGIGEAAVEELLETQMRTMSNPTIAPYAGAQGLYLRITAGADTEEAANTMIEPVIQEVIQLLKQYVIGIDIISFEKVVLDALIKSNLTISTAESCTGGYLSERLTKEPGSSKVYLGGVAAYDNAMKVKLLGVSETTLNKYGAVSAEVCIEMAKGIKNLSGSDVSIAITGILGPKGGSVSKPVGTIYIALNYLGTITCVHYLLDRGTKDSRERIRMSASSHAMKLLLDAIDKDTSLDKS